MEEFIPCSKHIFLLTKMSLFSLFPQLSASILQLSHHRHSVPTNVLFVNHKFIPALPLVLKPLICVSLWWFPAKAHLQQIKGHKQEFRNTLQGGLIFSLIWSTLLQFSRSGRWNEETSCSGTSIERLTFCRVTNLTNQYQDTLCDVHGFQPQSSSQRTSDFILFDRF